MPTPPQISHFLAERHESLWLRLSALHKDICAIAAKKPEASVGSTERATVEGLICDCRPFLKKPADRLPVAAQTFSGLAVQLGQVLAALEDFENRHAFGMAKRVAGCDAQPARQCPWRGCAPKCRLSSSRRQKAAICARSSSN